jgi:hypothetical protein
MTMFENQKINKKQIKIPLGIKAYRLGQVLGYMRGKGKPKPRQTDKQTFLQLLW